jgi:hypothetical protein
VTMRTLGHDVERAVGFLPGGGLVDGFARRGSVNVCTGAERVRP